MAKTTNDLNVIQMIITKHIRWLHLTLFISWLLSLQSGFILADNTAKKALFKPLTKPDKSLLKNQLQYTGEHLSLNFQDIEIRNVISLIAEFTQQNIVAGDDITGTITLRLNDVPWDEALDFIMMTQGLEKFQSGSVTLIAPIGKIKEYKEQQEETAAVIEQLEPLETRHIKINYARAENFRNLLNGLRRDMIVRRN